MATTNLFVELVVIGVGAAAWVAMLAAGVFGIDWIDPAWLQNYAVLVVLLAVVYLLGIISDRMADVIFDRLFSGPLRTRYFTSKREYQDARRMVFDLSGRLADMHEYGRTRIRICRGWTVNAALIVVSANFLLVRQFAMASWYSAAAIAATVGFGLLSLASWSSWQMLCATEYLKIRENAEYLRRHDAEPADHAAPPVRRAA